MIQTGDKRMAARARQAPESGFQAKDPAQRRGDTDRAVGVAAEAEMNQPAATAAAEPPEEPPAIREIVRVARRAIVAFRW